jgi:hypothetical protein
MCHNLDCFEAARNDARKRMETIAPAAVVSERRGSALLGKRFRNCMVAVIYLKITIFCQVALTQMA